MEKELGLSALSEKELNRCRAMVELKAKRISEAIEKCENLHKSDNGGGVVFRQQKKS